MQKQEASGNGISIASGALGWSQKPIVIYAPKGSYAESWAKENKTENFDLINKCNSYEGEMYVRNEFGRVQEETYVVYDANYDKVAQYLADELPEDFWKTYGPEKYAFKDKTWRIATEYTYDELPADFWDFFEFNGCTYKDYNVIFGPCAYVLVDDSFETVREYAINELPEDFWNDYDINSTFYYDGYMALVQYPDLPYYIELEWVDVTTKGPIYADLEGILAYNWEPFGETAYLMTITDVTTGETDPWGICFGRTVTMEEAVAVYESSYASEWGPALVNYYKEVYGCEPAHIKTWDTLKLEKILCLMRLYCIVKIAGVSIKNSSKRFLEICKFSLLFGLLPQFR